MTLLYFLIALGLLIFVHEIGHFILAKRQDVKVEEFSLGFGPRILGFKKGETDYRISALPLGGYVKMLGEDPEDEKAAEDPRSFAKKTVWQRVKIVACGPLMNLVFSLAIMPLVFFIGRSQPVFLNEPPVVSGVRAESPAAMANLKKGDLITAIDGKKVATWEDALNKFILAPNSTLKVTIERGGETFDQDIGVGQMPELKGGYVGIEPMLFLGNEAVIDAVQSGGPADEAGIRKGDLIEAVGGKPVSDWLDLSQKVNESQENEASIKVKRGEETLTVNVKPQYNEEAKRWLIGIIKDRQSGMPMTVVRLGAIDSIVAGTKENIKLINLTFTVLKRLFTGGLSYKILGGPVIIAKASAAAAASGFSNFLYFIAFLSLQLSIINILPIPVLDGGHLLFLGIEAVRRRPVSLKVRQYATQAGFFLLIAFMLLVTWNDLESVFGLRSLLRKLF